MGELMKLKQGLLTLVSSFFVFFAFTGASRASVVSQEIPYYGEEFYRDLASGSSNDSLLNRMKTILRSQHRAIPGALDQISDSCSGSSCYQHITLGYDRARVFMMGVYYLIKDESGYSIPDMYCGGVKHQSNFECNPPAPNQIPDGVVLNTEHTWPQSKFTHKYDREMQKSDLHHLYPTDSEMNSIRGNYEFGEVVKDKKILKCRVSRLGKTASGRGDVFEPPTNHKGNVARALFYFAVHYDMTLGGEQEATLRKWNHEDPVDEEEAHRNDEIMKVQGNRNPFVDFPELADRIGTFH